MKKISEALDGFFETYGIVDDKNYFGFVGSWNKLIGQDLACHSRPGDIRGTVLIISVDHPGWMTRMRFEEKKLLKKIRQAFPQLGITTLGYHLVDKLPKAAPLRKEEAVTSEFSDSLGVSGEQDVDKSKIFFEDHSVTPTPNNVSPEDFLESLKNLKKAMAAKSRGED